MRLVHCNAEIASDKRYAHLERELAKSFHDVTELLAEVVWSGPSTTAGCGLDSSSHTAKCAATPQHRRCSKSPEEEGDRGPFTGVACVSEIAGEVPDATCDGSRLASRAWITLSGGTPMTQSDSRAVHIQSCPGIAAAEPVNPAPELGGRTQATTWSSGRALGTLYVASPAGEVFVINGVISRQRGSRSCC